VFSIQVSWLPDRTRIFGWMSSGRTQRSALPPRWVWTLPTRIFGRMSSGADTEVRPPAALYPGPVGVGLRMYLQRTAHAKIRPPGVGTPGRPVLCGGTGFLPSAQAACARGSLPSAIHLNTRALWLLATNRMAEAEPLMRCVVVILSRCSAATQHPHLRTAISNCWALADTLGRSQDQILTELLAMTKESGLPWETMQQLLADSTA
jgi:hypothetical protein